MNIQDLLPPMLLEDEFKNRINKFPEILNKKQMSKSERLIHTQDIFDVYIANTMTVDVYHTIYFMMLKSCKRKLENPMFHSMNNESSLLTGMAGLGKTECIMRINEMMFNDTYLICEKPFAKILPILVVQCSTISSFKGFCLSIITTVDLRLNTTYSNSLNKNISTDEYLLRTAQILSNHVLVLVCEECNFLNESNRTISFANQIVGLSNLITTSILFVCTPKGLNFFKSSDYMARRSLNMIYKPKFNNEYINLVKELVKYSYTLNEPDLSPDVLKLIYENTNGIPALIKQVICECSTFCINSGYEKIDSYSVGEAIKRKLSIMEPFLECEKHSFCSNPPKIKTPILRPSISIFESDINLFQNIAKNSLKSHKNMIENLQNAGIAVEEIL